MVNKKPYKKRKTMKKPDDKKVLLYSGGMDSYILLKMFDYDEILFFKMGNEDNLKELEFIQKVPELKERIRVIDMPLGQFELENKILPYRNHILALMAANFGNKIYLGFTKGDTTKDKDYVYKSQIEGILNYFSLDTMKVAHQLYPYEICIPFKYMTKADMLRMYLEAGNDYKELLTNSRSCYSGDDKECGKCSSCLRKFTSFTVNYIDIRYHFAEDPVQFLDAFLEESIRKGRHEEVQEIEETIKKLKDNN